MYQHTRKLSTLENYKYIQMDYDIESWLDFIAFPDEYREYITGIVVHTGDGELLAIWLSESSRPYDINSDYQALPYYRPEDWNTQNLPEYWLESNEFYADWQPKMNHYGVYVSPEIPTTGVYNSNDLAWEWLTDEICLDCESQVNTHGDIEDYNDDCEYCQNAESYCLDWIECDSSHTKLIGDWIYDSKTKQYEPDKTGEFSAIVREFTVQVVWSKTLKSSVGLCSPCYPGQADIDSTGDFTAYALPEWVVYQD